jgi:hypothetical protein
MAATENADPAAPIACCEQLGAALNYVHVAEAHHRELPTSCGSQR